MNDPDAIKRMVEQARQEAARDHEPARPEPNAGAAREASARLLQDLPGELATICQQSSGAMRWGSEPISVGGSEFRLEWVEPLPERTLSILVEEAGLVLWGWFSERLEPSYNRMNAAGFTSAFLMALLGGLADQAAWEDGRLPELRLQN